VIDRRAAARIASIAVRARQLLVSYHWRLTFVVYAKPGELASCPANSPQWLAVI
jgi:hypothetical protein